MILLQCACLLIVCCCWSTVERDVAFLKDRLASLSASAIEEMTRLAESVRPPIYTMYSIGSHSLVARVAM